MYPFSNFVIVRHSEVKDRVVLKIYEPGFVEDNTLSIRNSTSTPIDLNVCSDSELADIELPDFRERHYSTVGSKPVGTSPDRFDPHSKRPNSTTPMEMGNRRMHPQQVSSVQETMCRIRSLV